MRIMKRHLFIVLTGMLMAGCKSKPAPDEDTVTVPVARAYSAITKAGCRDSTGLDGSWKLVKVHGDGEYLNFDHNETLVIRDCSSLSYYSSGKLLKTDSFKLFRVLSYCADYQLDYIGTNDSVSCVNKYRDTLIFGDCSTFESVRYYYKRM